MLDIDDSICSVSVSVAIRGFAFNFRRLWVRRLRVTVWFKLKI
jgi:hypothetical protein